MRRSLAIVAIAVGAIVVIGPPKTDGKMDYQIFAGADPESLKWAGDLFEDQWKRARPWHP